MVDPAAASAPPSLPYPVGADRGLCCPLGPRKPRTPDQLAHQQGLDTRDVGIDLVVRTTGTGEFHAIQCKLYAPDYRLGKSDIDSFFTASGKKPFTHRIVVSTTNQWSGHAEDALNDQQPTVSKIGLLDLETSQIDWSRRPSCDRRRRC